MPKGILRFKNMTVGRQNGELARFRVLGGPDTGVVFVVTNPRITIGRGEENDVILSDLKASRRHAELTLSPGSALLKDLGSSHGFVVNGVVQKLITLKNGDKVGMGETVLEFFGAEMGATQMIISPPLRTSPAVGTGTSGLTQFIPRPNMGAGTPASSGAMGAKPSLLEKNKKLIVMLGGLMLIASLLPEVERKHREKNKYVEPKDIERSIGSLNPPAVDPSVIKSAENHYREGFREFRARNYLRAQVCFETALQIYGDHSLSRVYLETTKKAMESEAKEHIKVGKRDEEASRLKDAKNQYEAVKRLYAKDQSNPLYKEADVKQTDLEKKIKDQENNN